MDPGTARVPGSISSIVYYYLIKPKVNTMPRPYISSFFFSRLIFLFALPTFILAHLIEIPAGKKDCFFEDLHIHDKVLVFPCVRQVFSSDFSLQI